MVVNAAATLSSSGRSSATPPTSLLCTSPGRRRLQRNREPDLPGRERAPAPHRPPRASPRPGSRSTRADAAAGAGSSHAPSGCGGERGRDDRMGAGAVDALELRHRTGWPASPVGEVGDPAERVRGRLRERERRDRALPVAPAERVGDARPPEEARHHRLVVRRLRGPADGAGDVGRHASPGAARRSSSTASTDSSASVIRSASSNCSADAPATRSTGFRTDAPAEAIARSASCVASVELRHLEARARARVGGEDARAARVGHDRDAATGRERLVREDHRGREQLVEGVDPDHAGLTEQRVDRDVGRGERGGVRRRGPAPGRGPAALHRDDRLRAAARLRASRTNLPGFPNDSR